MSEGHNHQGSKLLHRIVRILRGKAVSVRGQEEGKEIEVWENSREQHGASLGQRLFKPQVGWSEARASDAEATTAMKVDARTIVRRFGGCLFAPRYRRGLDGSRGSQGVLDGPRRLQARRTRKSEWIPRCDRDEDSSQEASRTAIKVKRARNSAP